jgi:hypothetical protein
MRAPIWTAQRLLRLLIQGQVLVEKGAAGAARSIWFLWDKSGLIPHPQTRCILKLSHP